MYRNFCCSGVSFARFCGSDCSMETAGEEEEGVVVTATGALWGCSCCWGFGCDDRDKAGLLGSLNRLCCSNSCCDFPCSCV